MRLQNITAHQRYIPHCDHCGKPASSYTYRMANKDTEFECVSHYLECPDCSKLSDDDVFAKEHTVEEQERNAAMIPYVLNAIEPIYQIADKLNALGCGNSNVRWANCWHTSEDFAPNHNINMVARIYIMHSVTLRQLTCVVSILRGHENDVHRVDITFPDVTLADISEQLLKHFDVAPDARVFITVINGNNQTETDIPVTDLAEQADFFKTALGDADTLSVWTTKLIDSNDALYQHVVKLTNLK